MSLKKRQEAKETKRIANSLTPYCNQAVKNKLFQASSD